MTLYGKLICTFHSMAKGKSNIVNLRCSYLFRQNIIIVYLGQTGLGCFECLWIALCAGQFLLV